MCYKRLFWSNRFRISILNTILSCSILLNGCSSLKPHEDLSSSSTSSHAAFFEDTAEHSNLNFKHILGNQGHFYFIETTPSGCAFIDFDNDGKQDVFLVQSGSSAPVNSVNKRPHCALFHNIGNGIFQEVTHGSGIDTNLGYGQGVTVADYDNDGFDDLFITSYAGNHLLRNLKGAGKFVDVTQVMGLGKLHDTGFSTGAAWGDYDNDGYLDLYVCYYAHWNYSIDKECRDNKNGLLDYCSPALYQPISHRLYHNEKTRFVDVSAQSGITKAVGRGLAATFFDFNGDGKPDIFVANDQSPSMLWKNNGNGTFSNVANEAGCAFDGQGSLLAGMGVSTADYNRTGRPSLYVSNFSSHPNILFKNSGTYFSDATQEANLGFSHLKFLSFGCEFLDYDADGWPDIITNNGHVQMNQNKREAGVPLMQRKQLLHNDGNGRFREITDVALLGDLTNPIIGRGLATSDFDNDGRIDVLAMGQNAPVQLLHNKTGNNGNHFVSFLLRGTKSNRDAIGARVELQSGGVKQTAWVQGGSSFLSSSDRRIFFGLGKNSKIEKISITWPSGKQEIKEHLLADTFYTVTEGKLISALGRSSRKS